jgi:gamma-glutamyltranspeptidase/glutathione hydrolase
MQMFYLDPGHANALVPGKRPRTTLTPSLAMKDGEPFMVFGTPGGDQQDQWTLQFFLNHVDFGMNIQEAVDAPNFHSSHFPASFYPHSADPGAMAIENRCRESVIEELRSKGHIVQVVPGWTHGRVLAIRYNPSSGVMCGAASPRLETGYAMGY